MSFHVESAELVHRGAVVNIERVQLRTPDGSVVSREVARHPGAVAVVAVHDGALVLVEQYRVAVEREVLEIPAGKRDIDGEAPEVAAARELVEEVGLSPGSLELLGSFVPAVGFCDEELLIYAAADCVEVPREVDGVEEAYSAIVRVPLADVDELLSSGRLDDAKTLVGLFWARDRGLLAIDG